MPTPKTEIIEQIFLKKFDAATRFLTDPTVTLTDVSLAIADYNLAHSENLMSTRNPANFFKDFIRNRNSANVNWPATVLKAGYTARQITGSSACFEFVRLSSGQTEAFPPVNFAAPTDA